MVVQISLLYHRCIYNYNTPPSKKNYNTPPLVTNQIILHIITHTNIATRKHVKHEIHV